MDKDLGRRDAKGKTRKRKGIFGHFNLQESYFHLIIQVLRTESFFPLRLVHFPFASPRKKSFNT